VEEGQEEEGQEEEEDVTCHNNLINDIWDKHLFTRLIFWITCH
jgi:hypothetical protein